jgi:hypothetical protein
LSKFNLFDGDYLNITNGLSEDEFYNKPYFNLALCSNTDSKEELQIGASIFNGVGVVKEELNNLKFNYENKNKNILNSESYKLGNSIVKKIKLFTKFWRK